MTADHTPKFGQALAWESARPRLRLSRLLVSWLTASLAVYVATWLPLPAEPIVGAEAAHAVLAGWRRLLQGEPIVPAGPA